MDGNFSFDEVTEDFNLDIDLTQQMFEDLLVVTQRRKGNTLPESMREVAASMLRDNLHGWAMAYRENN